MQSLERSVKTSRIMLFSRSVVSDQASPLSQYWNGLPFPSAGDLPNPGIEPGSPALQASSLLSEPPGKPCLVHDMFKSYIWCDLRIHEVSVRITLQPRV